jgi:ribose transport system permease protein
MHRVETPHIRQALTARTARVTPTLVITGVVVLLLAISQLAVTGRFFSASTLSTLTPLIGTLALVAVGQALVISTGGIDLSLPGTMTLMGAIVLKQSAGHDSRLLAALTLCAVACLAIGLLNGVLVEACGLNSLVVTLAVGQLVAGGTQLYRGAVPPVQQVPGTLSDVAGADVGGVSCILIVAFALAVLATGVLHRAVVGRRLVASSTAERAALLSGVKAPLYRVAAYVIAALVYGVGGVLAAGATGTPDQTLGDPYLLISVVAVVLGGAAVTGGRVSPIATLMGAIFIAVLDFDLRVRGLSAGARLTVTGAVLVLGLSLIHVIQNRATLGRAMRRLAG